MVRAKAKAKAKAKAQAKANPKDPILTQRRSPRFQAAIFKLAMLSAIMAGVVVAETPRWVPVEAPMGTNDTAIRELILREGVPGTVPEWRAGYEAEMKAVEGKRLIKLVGDELAVAMRGPCVRLRMRLEAKKDGRKKARLIVQGFREPLSWDVGGTDSPTAAMASIRTLLFMHGLFGDVISSIDVSTAFLQAAEYEVGSTPRYVYILIRLVKGEQRFITGFAGVYTGSGRRVWSGIGPSYSGWSLRGFLAERMTHAYLPTL